MTQGSTSKLVSVLMPAYNCEKFVAEAIRSVLNQTYSNFELFITDDASSDGTREVIKTFLSDQRIRYRENAVNKGYLQTSNDQFAEAKGEYITFLDSDDTCPPDRFEKMIAEMEKDATLMCIGSAVERIDAEGVPKGKLDFALSHKEILAALPDSFQFVGSALLLRREALDAVGFYPAAFDRIGSEDLFWGAKIALRYPMRNLPEALYRYRDLKTSVSSANKRTIRGQMSKELAQIAVAQLRDHGRDIFAPENEALYREAESYLMMKYNFWNDNYWEGRRWGKKSMNENQLGLADKNELMKSYFRKWVKTKIFRMKG